MRALLLAATLAACATAPPSAVDAGPVVAAERAFAARAAEIGWIPAFREFTAPDGQLPQAELENAPEALAATPDDGVRTLYWQPAYAGIARSGDFGFTTGPFSVDEARTPRGQYFTVWRRQPDGSWRWIFDGGPGPVAAPGPFPTEGALTPSLPVAAAGVGSAAAAVAQVSRIEQSFGGPAALGQYLAADAHVYRPGEARAYGGAAARALLASPSPSLAYGLRRVEASAAGDMVFTLGEAAWSDGTAQRRAWFGRIWQYRPEGWRIVYDQLASRAPPPG